MLRLPGSLLVALGGRAAPQKKSPHALLWIYRFLRLLQQTRGFEVRVETGTPRQSIAPKSCRRNPIILLNILCLFIPNTAGGKQENRSGKSNVRSRRSCKCPAPTNPAFQPGLFSFYFERETRETAGTNLALNNNERRRFLSNGAFRKGGKSPPNHYNFNRTSRQIFSLQSIF